jgi:polyferredoxin
MADVLLFEGRCSSRSHRCEWKNGLDDSVCIMILFMQVDIRLYDSCGDCMSLDNSCMLLL